MDLRAEQIRSREAGDREAAETRSGENFIALVDELRLWLLGLWLGAAIFFGLVVAPNVFSVLRGMAGPNANELAGSIVTRTLALLNIGGFATALGLLASALILMNADNRRSSFMEVSSLMVLAAATGVGHWIINARLLAMRLSMGQSIDSLAPNDPRRIAFNSLHVYSVMALVIAMLGAFVAWLLIARAMRSSTKRR
jgi:hypothetical protein